MANQTKNAKRDHNRRVNTAVVEAGSVLQESAFVGAENEAGAAHDRVRERERPATRITRHL